MLVNPVHSAVISNGMISLQIGQHIDLPDDVVEPLIAAGIVEPVKAKTAKKKVAAAPENKAVNGDA